MWGLAAGFALTALLYASVGFGGGSTYNALLVLADTDYRLLPAIALLCNLIVVTGGTIRFARAGQVPWRPLWPILLLSAPCAWAGGQLPVDKPLFVALLGCALLLAGLLMLVQQEPKAEGTPNPLAWIGIPIGMGVGFFSGIVGIGGGIFLAPVLHLLRWASARQIAASASVFILVNSLAGLAGQLMKQNAAATPAAIAAYWPLFVAVLIGGQIGSHAGVRVLPQQIIRTGTAALILYVAAQLLWQRFGG
ncbi:sulfite exporter TauE/SafE family protein [Blastomonas sp. AAP53]|uniref:sulfite exporter TauE/SafE family protein n=1 Tax=Blastomonas sp. AAP53 TaxID=1248760 RepID=UPI0002F8836D|nr:sulfite exporter TauE/SafE family protein [Blastomonas sp. AAP53]